MRKPLARIKLFIQTHDMIEIQCNASPFILKPVLQLVDQLEFEPRSTREGIILNLLNPFHEKFSAYRKQSHLTDSQTKEEQIRYLGKLECERKITRLAYLMRPYLKETQIIFRLSPYFEPHPLFTLFVKYLKQHSGCPILYAFEDNEGEHFSMGATADRLEKLIYSSDSKRLDEAQFIYESARTCVNSDDYYSAITILKSIAQLPHASADFKYDIWCELAIAHGAVGELKKALFYWNQIKKSENLIHKNRASYALGLYYTRHLPNEFQDVEMAEKHLQEGYRALEAQSNTSREDYTLDKVFNRSGMALATFKKGAVNEAQKMVEKGIAILNEINPNEHLFHQSVLYYNLAQCQKAKGETSAMKNSLEKLISLDGQFNLYHEFLTEFYIDQGVYSEALEAVNKALEIDGDHVPFHFLKGKIYFLLEDYPRAMVHFEHAYRLDPMDVGNLAYLTSIYNALEEFDAVIECLKNFHFKFSNNESGELIINNLIIALLNTNSAKRDFKELLDENIQLKPDSEFFGDIKHMISDIYAD